MSNKFKDIKKLSINIGFNIGSEQNGKGEEFVRPVIVYKKVSSHTFYGIPLTSNTKRRGKYYFKFKFKSRKSIALLNQVRLFDTKRVIKSYGKISKNIFDSIKVKLIAVLQ